MASIETLRRGATGAPAQTAADATLPDPAAFFSDVAGQRLADGRLTDDRLTGMLAFALAAERGEDSSPDSVARLKQEADAALCSHAIRYLHNNIEQLRQDAVTERLGQLPRPPGLIRLVTANLVALALAGTGAAWLALHPETLAGLTGLLAG